MVLSVLRLGHRIYRDKRITTHCCLVARAFGADNIFIEGDRDKNILESVNKVVEEWGGDFRVEFVQSWRKIIKKWNGMIIHLTQYGLPFEKTLWEVKKSSKDKLIIIGGKKVPSDIYKLVDYNISIYNQPHSEIAALCICLDRLVDEVSSDKFNDPKIKIEPQKKGKKVINL